MNKLFTKIAALALGMTMATGVGVAVASNSKAAEPVSAAGKTVKYAQTSTSAASVSSGTAPTGSSISFTTTYTDKNQLTNTNSMTYTISGYAGCKVTAITLSMKSNKSAGSGTFSAVAGSTTLASISSNTAFSNWYDSAGFSQSYSNIHVTMTNDHYTIGSGEDLVITISVPSGKSNNSLYCQSVELTYEAAGGSDYVGSLNASPSTWSGYDTDTLSVSSFTISGSKNGVAGAVTSSDYEFQGIGYMSGDNFVARDANFSSGNPTTADTRLAWKAKYPTTSGGSTYAWAYVTLTVTADTISSVSVSGTMTKTSYSIGSDWNPDGLVVTATYAHSGATVVTSGITWEYSPAKPTSTDITSVNVYATVSSVKSDSHSCSVTVINEIIRTDRITIDDIGLGTSSYSNVIVSKANGNAGITTKAVYNIEGKQAVANEPYFDIRNASTGTTKTYGGFIVKESAGTLKSISMNVKASNNNNKTIYFFGKNTAYSQLSDLIDNDKKGTEEEETISLTAGGDYSVQTHDFEEEYSYGAFRVSENSARVEYVDIQWVIDPSELTPEISAGVSSALISTHQTTAEYPLVTTFNNVEETGVTYSVTSQGTSYVTAAISNDTLVLTPVAVGDTTVTIHVIDASHREGELVLPVRVVSNYAFTKATGLNDIVVGSEYTFVGGVK